MAETDTYRVLTQIFHDLFADDTIVLNPETSAKDIEGWDSFVHLNLIVAVESRFGIKFRSDETEHLANVDALVAAIENRKAGEPKR